MASCSVGGQTGINYDFGELLPASVSGYVYVDANDNGVIDPGKASIARVQLTLLDAGGNVAGQRHEHGFRRLLPVRRLEPDI